MYTLYGYLKMELYASRTVRITIPIVVVPLFGHKSLNYQAIVFIRLVHLHFKCMCMLLHE